MNGHAGDFVIRECRHPNPRIESVNRRVELIRSVPDRPCRSPLQTGRCSLLRIVVQRCYCGCWVPGLFRLVVNPRALGIRGDLSVRRSIAEDVSSLPSRTSRSAEIEG